MMMPHGCKTRFFTDPSDGKLHIRCTCGWTWVGEPINRHADGGLAMSLAVQNHRPPVTGEPPLKVSGFVSGLPDVEPGR
jgi:hypothetical protein